MSGSVAAVFQNQRSFGAPPSSQSYTTSGAYTWVAPTGVTKVSVVVVGAGYNGIGGALSYKNNISVTPGNSYSLNVAAGYTAARSNFINCSTVSAGFTNYRCGDGGGNGGARIGNGGGGAGGYSSAGGYAGNANQSGGSSTDGGGGGGGGTGFCAGPCCGFIYTGGGGGGGGVGLFGSGSGGSGGSSNGGGGRGGSGGANATNGSSYLGGSGGNYGGGGACSNSGGTRGTDAGGAVRIIWPGNTRQFPSTCVGSP